MMLHRWNTLDQVIAYLKELTDVTWTPSALLEHLVALQPFSVIVVPPTGTPMLRLDDGEWKAWDYWHPLPFEVGDVNYCVDQWAMIGSARVDAMILVDRTEKNPERRIRRFRPLQPIPVDAVRLSPTDVELFLETFNIRGKNFVRLLEEFDTGERFPALRTQLASVDGAWRAGAESKRLEPGAAAQAPMPQAEVASPRAGYGVSRGKGEPKTREDSLSMQLVDLIGQMRRANEPVNAATVMHRLRKSQGDPGSCVVDQKADGVIYEKTMGSTALLTRAALHKRIKRFLEKGLV